MKNKPVLSLGNKNKEILEYISEKIEVRYTEIDNKFKLSGNGIFLYQLNKMALVEKVSRGRYRIRETGKKLLIVVKEIEEYCKNGNI